MTKGKSGTPHRLAISRVVDSNASVTTATAGIPAFSSITASSKLPDEQAPQSPIPVMAKSTAPLNSAIWVSFSGARWSL